MTTRIENVRRGSTIKDRIIGENQGYKWSQCSTNRTLRLASTSKRFMIGMDMTTGGIDIWSMVFRNMLIVHERNMHRSVIGVANVSIERRNGAITQTIPL